jgi:flagellar hook protein FlgE
MLGSIYIGLSGMTAFSKGLNAISNNVANLNTPGFKTSQPTFLDVLFQNGGGPMPGSGGTATSGAGVEIDTARQSFSQGELRDTGNPLDVAIDGEGYFVIERGNDWLFTRAGQFQFDKDGVLVDRSTGAKALVATDKASSVPFSLEPYRTFAPRATSVVNLAGILARTGTATFDLASLAVLDSGGGTQTLKAHFARHDDDPLTWTLEVSNASNEVIGRGDLKFNADGTPAEGNEPVTVTVKPKDQEEFSFVVKMGDAGSFSGITSASSATASSVTVAKRDGTQLGTLTTTAFDDHGRVTLTYSNGEKLTPATLLLAQFNAPDQFHSLGSGLLGASDSQRPQLAVAQTEGRGRIVGSKVEMSNVDLTQQFSDLIIIQRGFQASSQMTSIANEMIQQLLAMEQKP